MTPEMDRLRHAVYDWADERGYEPFIHNQEYVYFNVGKYGTGVKLLPGNECELAVEGFWTQRFHTQDAREMIARIEAVVSRCEAQALAEVLT